MRELRRGGTCWRGRIDREPSLRGSRAIRPTTSLCPRHDVHRPIAGVGRMQKRQEVTGPPPSSSRRTPILRRISRDAPLLGPGDPLQPRLPPPALTRGMPVHQLDLHAACALGYLRLRRDHRPVVVPGQRRRHHRRPGSLRPVIAVEEDDPDADALRLRAHTPRCVGLRAVGTRANARQVTADSCIAVGAVAPFTADILVLTGARCKSILMALQ